MPVSVRRSPFSDKPIISKPEKNKPKNKVKTKRDKSLPRQPQINVLKVMMPEYPDDIPIDWPLYTRATLRKACGLSPSNSMNRIIHGIKDGPTAHPGLLEAGYIEEIVLDISGVLENNYRITQKGIDLCLSLQGDVDPK